MIDRLLFRFALIYIAILLVSFASAGILIERQVRQEMTEKITEDLLNEGRVIANLSVPGILKNLHSLQDGSRARITVIDPAGTVIGDSPGPAAGFDNHLNRPEIQASRIQGRGVSIRYSATLKVNMLYVALPLREGDQKITAYVRLARPLTDVEKAVETFRRSLLLTVLPVLALSILLAFLFVAKIILPVRKMAAFTERIYRGERRGALRIESHDEIGQLARNINQMVDVLEEKIAQEAEEKGILTAAFESMAEGLIVLDNYHRIERVNRVLSAMTGFPAEAMLNKTPLEAFRNAELHQALERFNQTREPVLVEITLSQERIRVMEVSISAIRDLPYGIQKTVLVFHDVTKLKQLEKTRVDFVANVSHEIKTPLTNIIGFVETLETGSVKDQETYRRFLATIRDNALRLNRLVNDLLTLSNIELGETTLHMEDVDPVEVLEGVMTIMAGTMKEKRLQFVRDIPENLPPIRGDRDRLSQIFINILDNAVKYTPEDGTLTLGASRMDGEVVIRISDTGIGIPKSEIPKLGERFYRVDKARSRQLGGTGLGLSIVKHLMQAHGGRMIIDSTPGKGTTVSLYFPA
ncbi:MAG: ATP-binding protein [Syntrophales bacterium]|jgi:two-component system phosphate regulon sensor histidine kinase PhoR|nr:ATP-binding protein [Syntrophales bacterium]